MKKKTTMKNIRTYSELVKLQTFEERLEYLKLDGQVGKEKFGWDRWLNQDFYKSPEWKKARRDVIVRDLGRDLGVEGHDIPGNIYIHHMNPVTKEDLINHSQDLFNPKYLISVSFQTHQWIHYGLPDKINTQPVERTLNDTCPWKK